MPRALTPAAARSILARETPEVWLAYLTISGPGLDTIRIVHNTESITRNGQVFQPYPFEVLLPDDTDNASPQVQLRVDNVDRQVTRVLREYTGIPKVTLEIGIASAPDHTEVGPFDFSLLDVSWDAMTIGGTLGYEEDFLNQGVPAQTYTPISSPGLFR